jgi:hypothetical protein
MPSFLFQKISWTIRRTPVITAYFLPHVFPFRSGFRVPAVKRWAGIGEEAVEAAGRIHYPVMPCTSTAAEPGSYTTKLGDAQGGGGVYILILTRRKRVVKCNKWRQKVVEEETITTCQIHFSWYRILYCRQNYIIFINLQHQIIPSATSFAYANTNRADVWNVTYRTYYI